VITVTTYGSVNERENIVSVYSVTLYLLTISVYLSNFMTAPYSVIRYCCKCATKLFVFHNLSWL
jgi:hypothetical protein